jgi:hypothetical protein
LQRAFPLDVSIINSSMLTVATDGECLICGGCSLCKTIRFGWLEFIANCFDSLSLSTKGSDSGAIFMGTTRRGSLLLRAMIEDSIDEFYTASSGEGSSGLPISRRHSMGALPVPIKTTPWSADALTTQTMTMVPPWTLAPRSYTGIPLEKPHAFREGQRALCSPLVTLTFHQYHPAGYRVVTSKEGLEPA